MKVYLDACALNRLFDEQNQARIGAEAAAIQTILSFVLRREIVWVGSRALEVELMQNPDAVERADALELLSHADSIQLATADIRRRAMTLADQGYGVFDALHLAHAEASGVDILLTTDDRFLRKAMRGTGSPTVRVANPVDWLAEVQIWLHKRP